MASFVVFLLAATASGDVETCRDRLLAARAAMRDGQVKVRVNYVDHRSNDSMQREYHLYFQDDNVRMDVVRYNGPNTAEFRQVDAVADDEHTMYTTVRAGTGAPVVSTIKSAESMAASIDRIISHPRSIGRVAAPFDSISGYQPDQIIGGSGRLDETVDVEDGEYDGALCDVWIRRGPGYEVRGWISRAAGAPVLKVETHGQSEAITQIRTIQTKYDDIGGAIVPVSYEFTCRNNGELSETEQATIEYVSLNSGLEPDTFSLKGMDVEKGTLFAVYRPQESGDFVWDGTQLAPREVPMLIKPTPITPNPTGRRWSFLLAVNAAIFAGVAVYCLARWARGEKS